MTDQSSARRPNGMMALALTALSVAMFARSGATAYEWPTLHDGPLLARVMDPSFLLNDFITSSSSAPSPRLPFVEVLASLARLTGEAGGWYGPLFLLKAIIVVALPAMFLYTLTDLEDEHLPDETRRSVAAWAAFGCIAWFLISPWPVRELSIAWFPGLNFFAQPSNLSMLLLLAGTLLMRKSLMGGRTLWFASTVVHPGTGPLGMVFIEAARFSTRTWRTAALNLAVGALAPAILLSLVFRTPVSLSATEFVYHYARVRHPAHFVPSQFGTLTGMPWYESFSIVLVLLVGAAALAGALQMRRLRLTAALFAVTFGIAVLAQWLVIEVVPIKPLVAMGPVRYCQFGIWMLVLTYSGLLAELLYRWQPAFSERLATLPIPRLPAWALSVLLVLAVPVVYVALRDDPVRATRARHPALYEWLGSTPPDAVFAAPEDFTVDIPLIACRAVLIGNGFPFREDFFREHTNRQQAVYGSPAALASIDGTNISVKQATFYRSLKPADFVRIADRFRLDYVVVDSAHEQAFAGATSEFHGDGYAAYAISRLRSAK